MSAHSHRGAVLLDWSPGFVSNSNVARERCDVSVSREQQDQLHRQLLDGDPVAASRGVDLLFEPLVARLSHRWTVASREDLEAAAMMSLGKYMARPDKYDPSRASLLHYLFIELIGGAMGRVPSL